MKEFNYLIDKLSSSDFISSPFKMLKIDDFLNESHFNEIIKSSEVNTPVFDNDLQMFEHLFHSGYKIIDFPGCIQHSKDYIKWHQDKKVTQSTNTTCESFGMTLRLMSMNSQLLSELNHFFQTDAVREILANRFNLKIEELYFDHGIQKYLDGYEISPHPDIRRKALTYMLNINPNDQAHQAIHHTHYLTLKKEYEFIEKFWRNRADVERCWLPWDWCETNFIQNKNNSIVIFSPNNSTLHAVKAEYDHLSAQRTQMYGNFWYKTNKPLKKISWEAFDLDSFIHNDKTRARSLLNYLPDSLKIPIKNFLGLTEKNYIKIDNQPDNYK
tara:strand:- start:49 stop:1029 length:981 start_codon:yes stop_codon:yes gene_type:complete